MGKVKTLAAHPNEEEYNRILNFIEWYNREAHKNLSTSQFVLKAINYYCNAIQKQYDSRK